jgi:hypothetical protein
VSLNRDRLSTSPPLSLRGAASDEAISMAVGTVRPRLLRCAHKKQDGPGMRYGKNASPAKKAVIQLAFIAPSLQITPSRRRPGPMVQTAWSCPMGRGRRSDQTQVLVEAWVLACATDLGRWAEGPRDGEKSNSRIVTMFVEANWVTDSKAGAHPSSAQQADKRIPGFRRESDRVAVSSRACPWLEQGAGRPPGRWPTRNDGSQVNKRCAPV